MQSFIQIHPKDTVAVALTALRKGDVLSVGKTELCLAEDIAPGHKFALTAIPAAESVIKYGQVIGLASAPISPGQWVHTHNLTTGLKTLLDYTYQPEIHPLPPAEPRTFSGYRRPDGRAGIRNDIWIIPTVGCVNKIAAAIERGCRSRVNLSGIDNLVAFSHPYGCSQMGEDQEAARRILAALASHPNAGGVLVLGLGCENNGVETIHQYLGEYDSRRIRFLKAQDCEDEIEEGIRIIGDLAQYASGFSREPICCSELVIGMKCGGSDGLSGITANPAVGAFSDKLIAMGGSTILTEVPEMFGAEISLMNRCENRTLFDQTVELINSFKNYFTSYGQPIYENPSPGNKQGGISTLEEKSLGCTQKSGSAPVRGVLSYGDQISTKGLNLLSSPGNDLVASTALAAAGAHLVLFTTGRGTPFACPVPTVKLSTNGTLAGRKKNWIDFDCSPLLKGVSLDVLSEELLSFVLETASGRRTRSEAAGFQDMAIFKRGVTL